MTGEDGALYVMISLSISSPKMEPFQATEVLGEHLQNVFAYNQDAPLAIVNALEFQAIASRSVKLPSHTAKLVTGK